MTSSAQMKEYFHRMASGKIKPSDISYIKQKGRGLNNYRNKKLKYKINQIGKSSTILSPVEQNILQAKKKSSIKKRAGGNKAHSRKRHHSVKRSSAKTKKTKVTQKKSKQKKKRKHKDIFSK